MIKSFKTQRLKLTQLCLLSAALVGSACDDTGPEEPQAGAGAQGSQGAIEAGANEAGANEAGASVGGVLGGAPDAGQPAAGLEAGVMSPQAGAQAGEPVGGTEPSGAGLEGGEQPPPPPLPDPVCERSIPLSCQTGTIEVDSAQGAAELSQYECGDGFTFPGKELLFEFVDHQAQSVQLRVRELVEQRSVNYLLFALQGDELSCEVEAARCLGSQDVIISTPLSVDYEPGRPLWFSLDPRLAADASSRFELEVICERARCGDGQLDQGEACDDGNSSDGDGCSASCAVEEGYRCTGAPSDCFAQESGDCPEGIPLGVGSYEGDTRACDSSYPSISGGCGNQNTLAGPDQSFRVTIPPLTALRATLNRPESGSSPSQVWLALDPEQPSDSCVQRSSERVYWLNGSEQAREVLLVVDGVSFDDMGPYTLELSHLDPLTQVGASCAQPHVISESGSYQGSNSGVNMHGGVGGACVREGGFWGYSGGSDSIYRVTLQPQQRLSAVANAIGTWDHVLSIHDSCDDFERSCLSWDDYGRGSVTNEGDAPHDYFIMVGGFHPYSVGSFELEVSID